MFIYDDSFLTYEEQVEFANKIFDEKEKNWAVWRALEVMNIPGQKQRIPKSLVLVAKESYNNFQVVQDLNNKEYEYIFDKFCTKHNIKPKAILRARVNILTKSNYDNYNYPHVDNPIAHNVFLYYFNSSDGDTVIFDKKIGEDLSNIDDLPILHSIKPKMGAAIKFDGRHYHSSTQPKESELRCILNIDYRE
jgi:hypothetical protein